MFLSFRDKQSSTSPFSTPLMIFRKIGLARLSSSPNIVSMWRLCLTVACPRSWYILFIPITRLTGTTPMASSSAVRSTWFSSSSCFLRALPWACFGLGFELFCDCLFLLEKFLRRNCGTKCWYSALALPEGDAIVSGVDHPTEVRRKRLPKQLSWAKPGRLSIQPEIPSKHPARKDQS